MRKSFCLLMALAFIHGAYAADASLDTDKKKLSYIYGYQVGMSLRQQGYDLDIDILSAAIRDVLSDKQPKLSQAEMKEAIQKANKASQQKRNEAANKNRKAGQQFLDKNKKKKGVKTTSSGLQYKIIKRGKGKTPKQTDTVVAHYEGRLINGKVFDSSIQRGSPAEFPVGGVIKGWQEVLQLMKEGAKWQVYIPSELAYGERGAGHDIGPNETLVFDIELIKIK